MNKTIDLTGQKFGKLTVLSRAPNDNSHKGAIWLCRCDCGTERTAAASALKCGQTHSCKKCRKSKVTGDLTGLKFNRWTVVSFSHKDQWLTSIWNCKCECGTEKKVLGHHLTNNRTVSCGCYRIEVNSKIFSTGYKTTPSQVSLSDLFNRYKANATKRKKVFELTKEKFIELTQMNCHYCNVPPIAKYQKWHTNGDKIKQEVTMFLYNGIDRKDNDKGYTLENSVTSCKTCNYLKGSMDYGEFLEYIKLIFNHLKLNKK